MYNNLEGEELSLLNRVEIFNFIKKSPEEKSILENQPIFSASDIGNYLNTITNTTKKEISKTEEILNKIGQEMSKEETKDKNEGMRI